MTAGLRAATLLAAGLLAACTTDRAAVDEGHDLFARPRRSPARAATCSRAPPATSTPPSPPTIASCRVARYLWGVAARDRFWGGQVLALEQAVDTCVINFMGGQALDPEAEAAKALYEYLVSITPEGSPTATLPLTVVENITPIALGDAARGADLYRRACANCHGAVHTASGQILDRVVILPDVISRTT